MDVFAFATTKAEGFGIAIIEALAAEVPVVATDVGPCAEVLKDGEWGHLVPKAEPVRFGRALVATLSGKKAGCPSAEQVYRHYDRSNTAKEYWKILMG
jgi:glycosyltransferase involved in cell wall biosynthesis